MSLLWERKTSKVNYGELPKKLNKWKYLTKKHCERSSVVLAQGMHQYAESVGKHILVCLHQHKHELG